MKVIFVCVENSNRSQMAEAFARIHGGDDVEVYTAGSSPSGIVNPKAIAAMQERGYDLTAHRSKAVSDFQHTEFDVAVTMGCGDQCPTLRAKRREDWQIPDPKHLPPEQFRQVRELIEEKVRKLLADTSAGNEKEDVMSQAIQDAVRSKYGSVATSGLSSQQDGVRAVAEAFGYTSEQLASIPAEANMGLSCGNPTATASLKPGETVVDLGCGGGLDVFLAAAKVGPTGKAIGIDMTDEMLALARRNAADGADGKPMANVEFHKATIDDMPLPVASVDCVISNCVINLAPDKPAVFREIARILKPGGRVAVSDIALKKPLPPEVGSDLMAYVGCIAGAIPIEQYRQWLIEAGFAHVEVVDTGADLNAYTKVENQSGCCSSPSAGLPIVEAGCCGTPDDSLHQRLVDLLRRYDVNDFAASVRVFAVKPKH